jgi:hypothetical protein
MKVIPDSAGASALDAWLRNAEPDPSQATNVAAASSPPSDATQQVRDTAEDLLVLDVWDGAPPGRLSALQSLSCADASVQQWAEHIFSPLR